MEQEWHDLTKGEDTMADYLKNSMDLANWFALLGYPKSMTKLNDKVLSGLGEEWELLILLLSLAIATMSTEDLSAFSWTRKLGVLIINHE